LYASQPVQKPVAAASSASPAVVDGSESATTHRGNRLTGVAGRRTACSGTGTRRGLLVFLRRYLEVRILVMGVFRLFLGLRQQSLDVDLFSAVLAGFSLLRSTRLLLCVKTNGRSTPTLLSHLSQLGRCAPRESLARGTRRSADSAILQ
jgi:hypothetical protein